MRYAYALFISPCLFYPASSNAILLLRLKLIALGHFLIFKRDHFGSSWSKAFRPNPSSSLTFKVILNS